jgi:YgiT-type zinc finger domain-containing protein
MLALVIMKCLICRQAETVEGLTVVMLQREEIRYAIEKVPARICPNCGDALVEESVAQKLLQAAESRYAAGQWMETWAYDLP